MSHIASRQEKRCLSAVMFRWVLALVHLIPKVKSPQPDCNQSLPSNVDNKEHVEFYLHYSTSTVTMNDFYI